MKNNFLKAFKCIWFDGEVQFYETAAWHANFTSFFVFSILRPIFEFVLFYFFDRTPSPIRFELHSPPSHHDSQLNFTYL